jgi:hypothetical protein
MPGGSLNLPRVFLPCCSLVKHYGDIVADLNSIAFHFQSHALSPRTFVSASVFLFIAFHRVLYIFFYGHTQFCMLHVESFTVFSINIDFSYACIQSL